MAEFRLSPEAESELDDIWVYIARASSSYEIATRMVDRITDRVWLLAQHPYLGRRRDDDLGPSLRTFCVDDYVLVHRVEPDGVVLILHVFHGSRDISDSFSG